MTNEELKKIAIKSFVFLLISSALLIYSSSPGRAIVTDAKDIRIDKEKLNSAKDLSINSVLPEDKEKTLIIPLPKDTGSDKILFEDDYVNRQLRIKIDDCDEGFYLENAVSTDLDILENAFFVPEESTESVYLFFSTDKSYVSESKITDKSELEVSFYDPSTVYEHIVVVKLQEGYDETDIAAETAAQNDIVLSTAQLLGKLAEEDTEHDIRLYFSNFSEYETPIEMRSELVKELDADLFVELSLLKSDDSNMSGISSFYNDRFFMRKLSNAHFADLVERNCSNVAGARANGVFPAGEDDIIMSAKIPSVNLCLGYTTSENDNRRLSNINYRKKLAEGIYDSIIEAFEVMG